MKYANFKLYLKINFTIYLKKFLGFCHRFWQICQILRVHILSDFVRAGFGRFVGKVFRAEKFSPRNVGRRIFIFFWAGKKFVPGIYVDDDFFIDDA